MDFYEILGISRDADAVTIKKAYRKLVKECHPDTHPGDRQAEEKFKRIAEAYAVLSDDEKRRQYNQEITAPKGKRRQFENMFSFVKRDANSADKKNEGENGIKKNPLNTSELFEKYMGFK